MSRSNPTPCAALVAAIVLAGCTGDERPFEEAVEVRELGLRRLQIQAPANSLDTLSVGVGDRIDFDVIGFGSSVTPIELDDTDRDWRVDEPAFASISRSGVVTGLADGTVQVDVVIGGLVSEPRQLTVSSAALASLSISGQASVDPCLAARYSAIGSFADGTSRPLTDIVWSVPPGSSVSLRDGATSIDGAGVDDASVAGSILFIANSSGAVGAATIPLRATSGPTTLARDVSVGDTLRSIVIPNVTRTLRVDATLDLTARGSFTRGDATTELDVTDTVSWSVLDGSGNARVSDSAPDRGRVTGRETGNATVQAACGEVTDSIVIGVNSAVADTDNTSGLIFQNGGTQTINLNGVLQLRVSTGSSYDADRDVTDDADITFTSSAANIVSVIRDGANAGQLSANGSVGQNATITASRNGASAAVIVTIR